MKNKRVPISPAEGTNVASFQLATRKLCLFLLHVMVASFCIALSKNASSQVPPASGFERLSSYRGLGIITASVVGPGVETDHQALYLTYVYAFHFELVAVDPETGRCSVYRAAEGQGISAPALVLGPDGRIYLGTSTPAHLLVFDPNKPGLVDLGSPAPSEKMIWDLTVASDGILYGATYPHAKLLRYDPNTHRSEDLGKLDPIEEYGHYVAADNEGFVYIGIGTSKANIAAFEIASGQHREILPPEYQSSGQSLVFRAKDGRAYGKLKGQLFSLKGWKATKVTASAISAPETRNVLKDGRYLEVQGSVLTIGDKTLGNIASQQLDYEGGDVPIFRITKVPDGSIYGSTMLPLNLFRLDPGNDNILPLGKIGDGEAYTLLPFRGTILIGAYAASAPLMVFSPELPISADSSRQNPMLVTFPGADLGWRPQTMIIGSNHHVYIGSVPGYGKLGGALIVWDAVTGTIEQFSQFVQDQALSALVSWRGLIVAGSATTGGLGSHQIAKEARLVIWDPRRQTKLLDIVPVPRSQTIIDLVTLPTGLVYGIANPNTLFILDPAHRTIRDRITIKPLGFLYNSIGVGRDGKLWGLCSAGIFNVDSNTKSLSLVAKSPQPITGGFALDGDYIYFISGSSIYRYRLSTTAHIASKSRSRSDLAALKDKKQYQQTGDFGPKKRLFRH